MRLWSHGTGQKLKVLQECSHMPAIERSSKDEFRETSNFVGHWMMMWLTMIHPCQVQGKV